MFTGIIEDVATVEGVEEQGTNLVLHLVTPLAGEFRVDESISHDGVCLTVEEIHPPDRYRVTAIHETLERSSLRRLKAGLKLNLERAMPVNGRLDGHFVQGHVDAVGEIIQRVDQDGSWDFTIRFPEEHEALIVHKGSICVDGISLTVARSDPAAHTFTVSIIPHTMARTNLAERSIGDPVNLEFDVLGKYVQKFLSLSR